MIDHNWHDGSPDALFEVEAAQITEQLGEQPGIQIGFVLEQQVHLPWIAGPGGQREEEVGLQLAEGFINEAGGFGAQGVEVEFRQEGGWQNQAEEVTGLVEIREEVAHEDVVRLRNSHGGSDAAWQDCSSMASIGL